MKTLDYHELHSVDNHRSAEYCKSKSIAALLHTAMLIILISNCCAIRCNNRIFNGTSSNKGI